MKAEAGTLGKRAARRTPRVRPRRGCPRVRLEEVATMSEVVDAAGAEAAPGPGAASSHPLAPKVGAAFRPGKAGKVLREVLAAKLTGVHYSADDTSVWTREIADEIKVKLREMEPKLDRYKFVVQVVIGEQRGEGVKMGTRCFWDQATDGYATETFSNESIFAVAIAHGIYVY